MPVLDIVIIVGVSVAVIVASILTIRDFNRPFDYKKENN